MNNETEANKILAWLLKDLNPTSTKPSATPSGDTSREAREDELGAANLPSDHSHLFDSQDAQPRWGNLDESDDFLFQDSPLSRPGEIPTVQDRFYSLLRRRLRDEVARKPPLFPWETEVLEYESEYSDLLAPELVPSTVWAAQLPTLNLPVPMPDGLMNRLFDQCQQLVRSSLREGEKLVQVVESLFPGHAPALNELAGYVLASPARSGGSGAAVEVRFPTQDAGFPDHYNAATAPQQMVLSLVAAREILNSLTLAVTAGQPKVERQWHTTAGVLTLQAEWVEAGCVRVRSILPCAGQIQSKGNDVEAVAQRPNAGALSIELIDLVPEQIYPLEVHLTLPGMPMLTFAVQVVGG